MMIRLAVRIDQQIPETRVGMNRISMVQMPLWFFYLSNHSTHGRERPIASMARGREKDSFAVSTSRTWLAGAPHLAAKADP
jgi:hypothetical protein